MTPAIDQLKKRNITFTLHQYEHDPYCSNFGEEAAEKLALDPSMVFKTLLVSDDKSVFVCIVPVTGTLNLKRAASAIGVKKLHMADTKAAERLTGYLLGGISPIGQKKSLVTCIDQSATTHAKMYVSGGQRGLDIGLAPHDLSTICRNAKFADIAEHK
ncbi:Cys-tRNA(Pro) deacylase [Marinomonas sp. A79]|uniref:Cys-tRNA(Pro)/Cys-tRNA(Cys) deacylase n=1 Tax=Marinomonas vulgaris TaxID=2823372 RepID=A0ABS5H9A1_9GAMM|nr:Cys-tRNA(Pro) deacylase [Marinomonas vulgaris]MBR7888145.1 Cys-tRNA(Pro) deacylase [Marinomonas vulgaris]